MFDIIDGATALWERFGAWAVLLIIGVLEMTYHPIRRIYKSLELIEANNKLHKELADHVTAIHKELTSRIEEIHIFVTKELSYNGQSSTKDAIARTEQLVSRIAAQTHVGMELHPYGIFMCDLQGKVFFVNRTFAYLCESTKEELLDFGWQNFLQGENYLEEAMSAYEHRKDFSAKTKIISRSGDTRDVHVITTVLQGLDGHMGYIIPIQNDNNIHTAA